jgi:hypothetical protein
LAIALPVTVYLVQQQQSLRQDASSAKTLSLTPKDNTKKVGEVFKLNIVLHPNGAYVKYVNLVINYNENFLSAKDSFVKNPNFKFLLIVPTTQLVRQFYDDIHDYNVGYNNENKNQIYFPFNNFANAFMNAFTEASS